MFLIQVHDRRVFKKSIHRYYQTNSLFWPLLSCPFKNCAYCTSYISLAHSFSQFLPVISSLHSLGFSPQFLFSYPFSSMLSLQPCSSSLQFFDSSIPATKIVSSFQYLHPAFILSICTLRVFGSLLDLSLCFPRCHNPSLLPRVTHNSCLAFYPSSSSPQQKSCSQTSLFSQYLPLPLGF